MEEAGRRQEHVSPRGFAMRNFALVILGALVAVAAYALPPHQAGPSPVAGQAAIAGTNALTQADADTWLDGFMPYALERGDVAGAVVVIVKDGQILTQRGFGYADIAARKKVDPATTLFRVGSQSKLFTWTAVMQLVEQGKIDLDADVNRYLDFSIPPYEGKPLTMRNIMTHTSGFEEVMKGGITYSGKVDPLGVVVKRLLPKRVFAPGTTPAYSNYATALAGYIVERVSGIPFDAYIERKIFQPLGMNHSSFRQPLPASLATLMAKGYPKASEDPKPFELISVPPAGSLTMSGPDGAKFMIAQLNQASGLLKPETARIMQTPAYGAIPGLDRMALGFYEQRINDLHAIAHGGDLISFHGYMWLFPGQNVGLMIQMNSAGANGASAIIRQKLFEQFSDRYFPAANGKPPVELPTAKEHARMLVGTYSSSRAEFTTFLDVANFLNQQQIGLTEDGHPLVPQIFGGPPRKWVEVAPFVWQDAYGHGRLAATVEGGRVVRWSINELSPFMVFDRTPWYRDASWLVPLFQAALAIIAVAALSWPISAILRRRYGATLALADRDRRARRLTLLLCWVVIAAFIGWALVFTVVLESLSTADWPILLSRILGTIGIVALAPAAAWNLFLTWKRGSTKLAKISGALLLAAALVIFWVGASFHLIGLSTRF